MTPDAPDMLTHETLHSRLHIDATLCARTAFRIGTGRDIDPHTPDLPVLRDALRRPFIPGSSLKGVLRSGVEQIARALAGPDPERMKQAACIITSEDEWCIAAACRDELRRQHQSNDAALARAIWERTCRVCRVFGSPWFAGKLCIRDLKLCEDPYERETTEIRDGVAIDRDSGTAADGKLYQYEVARAGLGFELKATLDNANDEEQGLVLMAFRLLKQGDLRVGGASSRGLGVVELNDLAFRRFMPGDADSVVSYLMGDAAAQTAVEDTDELIKACVEDLKGVGAGAQDATEPCDT